MEVDGSLFTSVRDARRDGEQAFKARPYRLDKMEEDDFNCEGWMSDAQSRPDGEVPEVVNKMKLTSQSMRVGCGSQHGDWEVKIFNCRRKMRFTRLGVLVFTSRLEIRARLS
ncbi:hypothetical protein MANES_07G005350v8 [Manihot esculenta]|uniref:Uncharacterized protein n=1 Tax=Manihot esculenta TaxID=3983 RepID=A0ACB7HBQ2_MANES|nr:hypothetical protein MANES_07G005350v8 [Manihot esculenta]